MHLPGQAVVVVALLLGAGVAVGAADERGRSSSAPRAVGAAAYCSGVDADDLRRPYVFRYGLDGAELQSAFFDTGGVSGQGYRPRRLTGYRAGSRELFATRWVNAPGPAWRARYGLTAHTFNALYTELRSSHRPIDVSGYAAPGGAVRYAAIWEQNTPQVDWRLHRDVDRAGMQKLVDAYEKLGFVPLRVEGYVKSGGLRYVSIWAKTPCTWRMHNRMTASEYQSTFDEYAKTRRLVHLDAFMDGGKVYYAGIWWKQPGPGQDVRSDRDWYAFQRFFNNNACSGRVLDGFYATDVPGAIRYGGIWTSIGAPAIGPASSLDARVGQEVNCAPARAGAAVINLTTGQQTLVHADAPYGTASSVKSAILYAVLRRIDGTDDTLDTVISVGTAYGSDNGGTLAGRRTASIRYLTTTMIANSNNWASNRLIDYAGGFGTINAELAALGLGEIQLRRYFKGSGAPSVSGNSSPSGDYAEGIDNTATPRQYATLMRRIHENNGRLSRSSWSYFWSLLGLNSGAHDAALDAGVATSRGSIVSLFEKAGSNPWTSGVQTKPQLADVHFQRSAAGRLVFGNGQVAVYAVFVDEGTSRTATRLQNAIDCVVMHAVRQFSGTTTGADVPTCAGG